MTIWICVYLTCFSLTCFLRHEATLKKSYVQNKQLVTNVNDDFKQEA